MTDEELDELVTPIAEQLTLREFAELISVVESLVSKGIWFTSDLTGCEHPLLMLTDKGRLVLQEADSSLSAVGYHWMSPQQKPPEFSEAPERWLSERWSDLLSLEVPSEARARKFAEQRKAASFRKGSSRR